jgi:hypothetical protein
MLTLGACLSQAPSGPQVAIMNQWIHSVFSWTSVAGVGKQDVREIAGAGLLTILTILVFRWRPLLSAKVLRRFHTSANHVTRYVLAAMLLPLALRLALLPWLPPPEALYHDEFSHLLVADTLAAGRLANPPHTLWRHLETIYILQHPTYSSIYPIGQGFILAVGKVLTGNVWGGVLLAVALMCGAISWMLYGCLPPKWAAVGGLLAAIQYGLAEQWVNSYMGGAFCAFGGALLFGALCRLRKVTSLSMALLVGLGWSIVWLTRPFESLLLLLISWGFIAAFSIRDPRLWRRWLGPIVLILSIQVSAGCITALHNHAVTGSVKTLPYQLSQQAYGVPQSLLWQKAIEEPPLRIAEFKEMYWWQRKQKDLTGWALVHHWGGNLYHAWQFFVGPWYSLPILLLVFQLKDWQVIVGGGVITGALTATAVYPFFFPHYIAAYSCVISFLIFRGMMAIYQWHIRGKHVGSLVVLFLMSVGFLAKLQMVPLGAILKPGHITRQESLRVQVSNRLMRESGRHVVFIRYGPNHNFHDEWVYNAADIDASPIVWCRAINPTDDAEVTQYYTDRQFWTADVDKDSVRVSRYQPRPQIGGATHDPWEESQDWALTSRSSERMTGPRSSSKQSDIAEFQFVAAPE